MAQSNDENQSEKNLGKPQVKKQSNSGNLVRNNIGQIKEGYQPIVDVNPNPPRGNPDKPKETKDK